MKLAEQQYAELQIKGAPEGQKYAHVPVGTLPQPITGTELTVKTGQNIKTSKGGAAHVLTGLPTSGWVVRGASPWVPSLLKPGGRQQPQALCGPQVFRHAYSLPGSAGQS